MFNEFDQESLRELAASIRHLARNIDRLSYFPPGTEDQAIDVLNDMRKVSRKQESILQRIQSRIKT